MKNLKFSFFENIINNIDLEILEHGHLYADESWKHYNINSPYNRLYFILDGEGYIENGKHKVTLEKGKVYLIPIHSTYNYICMDSLEKFYLHFRMEIFNGFDIFQELAQCEELPIAMELMDELITKTRSDKLADIICCKYSFLQIIMSFILDSSQNIEAQIPIAQKYKRIFEYMKQNNYINISTSNLSDLMNITTAKLTKDFKQDTGSTIKRFVDDKIIQLSKDKLLLTKLTVKEIAYAQGFSDEFYFSKFFKKKVGLSPREYRTKNRI